jgi:hypothetical protein
MTIEHQHCPLVLEHHQLFGEIKTALETLQKDATETRKAVSNGLKDKLAATEKALDAFIAQAAADKELLAKELELREQKIDAELELSATKVKNELNLRAAKAKGENWFNGILSKSVTKIISIGIIFIALNALTSSGFTLYLKEHYSGETAGQQKEILAKQNLMMGVMGASDEYHSHFLKTGETLWHTGKVNEIAWKVDKKGNIIRCPELRTDEGLK